MSNNSNIRATGAFALRLTNGDIVDAASTCLTAGLTLLAFMATQQPEVDHEQVLEATWTTLREGFPKMLEEAKAAMR